MTENTFDLEILLPHRAPMILLSRAVDYSDDFAQAEVLITEQSAFF
ncbi:MAG: 3-hydroxylacyl-ACP dehydratase, partial [Cellvibrionales bacterium]